jgi:hypothetical protein
MDYRIYRSKAELNSTGYMEIGPGRYSGVHWQDGFLFVWGDAFTMAEGIVAKHFPDYDHFATNDIPKAIGERIIANWFEVGRGLSGMSPEEALFELNLSESHSGRLHNEVATHGADIEEMIRTLATECAGFYKRDDWVCILGM